MPNKEQYAKYKDWYTAWRLNNKNKIKAACRRYYEKGGKAYIEEFAVNRRYHISSAERKAILAAANGIYQLCELSADRLVLDHNHKTGKVRAALCYTCNTGLGHFGDNIQLIEKAVSYLKKHNGLGG